MWCVNVWDTKIQKFSSYFFIGGFSWWLIRKLHECISSISAHTHSKNNNYVYVHMHKWMRKDSDARRNRVNKIFFYFVSFYFVLLFTDSFTLGWWVKFCLYWELFSYSSNFFSWNLHKIKWELNCKSCSFFLQPLKFIVRCYFLQGMEIFNIINFYKSSMNLFIKNLLASSHLHIFLASEFIFYFLIFFFFLFNTIFCCSGNFWNSLMSASCCLELKQIQIRRDICVYAWDRKKSKQFLIYKNSYSKLSYYNKTTAA